MVTAIAIAAIVAFATSTVLYVGDVASETPRPRPLAFGTLVVAVVLSAVLTTMLGVRDGAPALLQVGDVFALLATGLGAVFLAVQRFAAVRVAGALVAPAGAGLLAAFLLEQARTAPPLSSSQGLLLIHIGLAVLGLAMFGIAAIFAALYLVQDRMLRERRFGVLFQRLPSLEELDSAQYKLVLGGFLTYSVAVVLGVVWAFGVAHTGFDLRIILGLVAWAVFAAVIQSRIATGWGGRQAAWLTVAGCLVGYGVLGIYAAGGPR
jgi:ABC-type uncharacterized transport system permease subunit